MLKIDYQHLKIPLFISNSVRKKTKFSYFQAGKRWDMKESSGKCVFTRKMFLI